MSVGPKLVIYGVPLSQPWRAVVWSCLLKRAPFKAVVAVPGAGGRAGTAAAEFRAKFPLGTVPALEHVTEGGATVRLTESPAILAYLADVHGWGDLYPTDRAQRAKIDEYMHWHHGGVRSLAKAHFAPRMRPDLVIGPEARQTAEALGERSLDLVETAFLAGGNGGGFIGGRPNYSVADLLCYSEVACLGPRFGNVLRSLDSGSKRPRLAAWLGAMAEVPHHDAVFAAAASVGKLDDPALPPLLDRLAPATKAGFAAVAKAATE